MLIGQSVSVMSAHVEAMPRMRSALSSFMASCMSGSTADSALKRGIAGQFGSGSDD